MKKTSNQIIDMCIGAGLMVSIELTAFSIYLYVSSLMIDKKLQKMEKERRF